ASGGAGTAGVQVRPLGACRRPGRCDPPARDALLARLAAGPAPSRQQIRSEVPPNGLTFVLLRVPPTRGIARGMEMPARPGVRPSPLRARRLLRGWRLNDLERATGIADTVLSRLERGEHPLLGSWLRRLAAIYDTRADVLAAEHERWQRGVGI